MVNNPVSPAKATFPACIDKDRTAIEALNERELLFTSLLDNGLVLHCPACYFLKQSSDLSGPFID